MKRNRRARHPGGSKRPSGDAFERLLRPVTGRLDQVNDQLSVTNQQLAEVSRELNQTNELLAKVDNKLDAVNQRLDVVVTKITGIDTNLADVRTNVADLRANLATTNKNVGVIAQELGTTNTRLESVSTKLTGTNAGLEKVDKKLSDTNQRLEKVDSRIDDVAKKIGVIDTVIRQRSPASSRMNGDWIAPNKPPGCSPIERRAGVATGFRVARPDRIRRRAWQSGHVHSTPFAIAQGVPPFPSKRNDRRSTNSSQWRLPAPTRHICDACA